MPLVQIRILDAASITLTTYPALYPPFAVPALLLARDVLLERTGVRDWLSIPLLPVRSAAAIGTSQESMRARLVDPLPDRGRPLLALLFDVFSDALPVLDSNSSEWLVVKHTVEVLGWILGPDAQTDRAG